MNSSNGTYLENIKLIPFKLYELINNGEIKFGDVDAKYLKVSVKYLINVLIQI